MNKTAIFLICLTGCAPVLTQMQIIKLAEAKPKSSDVVCDGPECAEAWGRVQVWLAKHSIYKIQTVTDSVIETYGPTYELDPMACGFSVTKEPMGNGKFTINCEVNCFSKMISSRIPEPEDIKNAFLVYMESGRDILSEAGPPMTAVNP